MYNNNNNNMAFHIPLDRIPVNNPVTVGMFLIDHQEIKVLCFPITGSVFIDGRAVPSNLTIGESFEYIFGEQIFEIDIMKLTFQRAGYPERPAHDWERKRFLYSKWKPYAVNNVLIYCEILIKDLDESIFCNFGEP